MVPFEKKNCLRALPVFNLDNEGTEMKEFLTKRFSGGRSVIRQGCMKPHRRATTLGDVKQSTTLVELRKKEAPVERRCVSTGKLASRARPRHLRRKKAANALRENRPVDVCFVLFLYMRTTTAAEIGTR